MKPYFGDGRLLLFAHRGGAKRWPENTLFAFERAYALGFRWIETDVQLSADGVVVVHHDLRVERTTNGRGLVADHSLGARARPPPDAGHRYTLDGRSFPYRGRGLRVPTLEEALALAPDVRLNLEMKGTDLRLPDALFALLEAAGARERVLVAAANDALTDRFRELAGDRYATSAGIRGALRFWLAVRARVSGLVRPRYDALQLPPREYGLPVLEPRLLDAAHRLGLQVHAWTIDDPAEMRRLATLGVDGVMSDVPERLLATLGDAVETS